MKHFMKEKHQHIKFPINYLPGVDYIAVCVFHNIFTFQ